MVSASELLGNTPTVARSSYVDPRVLDLYVAEFLCVAPTATLGAIAGVVVDSRASVSWSANSLAPIQVYDVRSRQARFGSTLGSWTTWRTGTPSVTGSK